METNGIDIYQSHGVFQFNALETGLPGNPNTGNAVASFLLGTVDRGTLRDFAYYPRNRYKYYALYAQDDWKATRKLDRELRTALGHLLPALREEQQPFQL